MTGRRRPIVVGVSAVLLLFAVAVLLQTVRDRGYPLETSQEETLYLSQRATSRMVFAQRPLASDLYWIRAIQYYGGRTKEAKARFDDALEPPPALAAKAPVTFDLLYPLLDITTTLDPRFNIAYRFGAIFLSENYPHGPGRPDYAVALLEKGLRAMPEKWQYWQDIGFVYYWNYHDYRQASAAFQHAADIPGGPWWMRSMAATMLIKGGGRNTSRALWQLLYDTANNDYARNAARLKLQQLRAIEEIEQLQAAYDRGLLRRLPRDPAGTPYVLSGTRIRLSNDSPLFPLPIEPGAGPSR